MLTLLYGRADAVQQAAKGVAAALGQGVHGKAHAAGPQAAELQRCSLHCLLQQRLQPLTPCASLASCASEEVFLHSAMAVSSGHLCHSCQNCCPWSGCSYLFLALAVPPVDGSCTLPWVQ